MRNYINLIFLYTVHIFLSSWKYFCLSVFIALHSEYSKIKLNFYDGFKCWLNGQLQIQYTAVIKQCFRVLFWVKWDTFLKLFNCSSWLGLEDHLELITNNPATMFKTKKISEYNFHAGTYTDFFATFYGRNLL